MKNKLIFISLLFTIGSLQACSTVDATGDAISTSGRAVGNAGAAVADGAGDIVEGAGDAVSNAARNTERKGY